MKPGRHAYARRMARHLHVPEPVVDPVARLPDVSPDGVPQPAPTWLLVQRAHSETVPSSPYVRGEDDDENAW